MIHLFFWIFLVDIFAFVSSFTLSGLRMRELCLFKVEHWNRWLRWILRGMIWFVLFIDNLTWSRKYFIHDSYTFSSFCDKLNLNSKKKKKQNDARVLIINLSSNKFDSTLRRPLGGPPQDNLSLAIQSP